MTKKFVQQWLLFAFVTYIITGFTSGRFPTYLTDQSRIIIDILISIFPSFVLAFPVAYIFTRFIFKQKAFAPIYTFSGLIYKRILANIIDYIIFFVLLTVFLIPFSILWSNGVINSIVYFCIILASILLAPICSFYLSWKSGKGTMAYQLLKLELKKTEKSRLLIRSILKQILFLLSVFGWFPVIFSLFWTQGEKDLLDTLCETKVVEK